MSARPRQHAASPGAVPTGKRHRHLAWCLLLVAPLLSAQSLHKCLVDGRTRFQEHACSVVQASDRTLRKCVSRRGAVSIQNEPCAPGSDTAWIRATAPEQPSAAVRRRLAEDARRRDAGARYLSHLAGTDRYDHPGHRRRSGAPPQRNRHAPSACELARRHRQSVLERVGLRRTTDLLRALNDRVYEACQ